MEFNLLPQIAGACGGSLYPETPPLHIVPCGIFWHNIDFRLFL